MTRPVSKRKRTPSGELGGGEDERDDPRASEGSHQKKVRWGTNADPEKDCPDQEEECQTLGQICLTAWCLNWRIGCAYCDPVTHIIYVLEDTQESPHFDLIKMILDHAHPDIVLTSSRADDKFVDTVRAYGEEIGSVFQVRPHKDFTPAKGRDRLLSLRLLSDLALNETESHTPSKFGEANGAYGFMPRRRDSGGDPTLKRRNAIIRLSNFASAESSPLCMASVGALIDHLVRERAISDLDAEGVAGLEILNIEMLSLESFLHINSDALFSLQIFNDESHASVHSNKTKEGLSLFGILNHTKTALGRSLLRTWLLRPTLSIPTIIARQDAVECFLRLENLATADIMHDHLKGVKNIPRTLGMMRGGRAKTSDWQAIVKFTFHSSMLRDALNQLHHAGGVEIVSKVMASLEIAKLREVGKAINEIIDWEQSITSGRVCVRPHIDEELDNRKNIYYGIDSILSKVAEQLCETVPANYASLNVVYFPQLGFLVCVPLLEEWKGEEGIQAVDGWSFQFASESHVYFKSQEMHDMDTHIGDLHSSIVDREIEIVQDLVDRILVFQEAIEDACDVCAELDCLLSFAQVSRAYDYKRPQMVEDNIIDITGGRHPLYEQVLDTFVPNDALIVGGAGIGLSLEWPDGQENHMYNRAGGRNSVLLCTGANACGKSVYLKQIALIQYMAQIGCFVPAQSATLGVVDKIFTRIATLESVSKVQSAFMIDLNQASLALRNSTARSLILLDEFGKGTQSSDGAGLFCGVIKHFLRRGSGCPKVLAATHFHDIFRQDLLDGSLPIAFLHMEIMFTSSSGESLRHDSDVTSDTGGKYDTSTLATGESITYLYRVAPGLSLHSHATQCAAIFGVPHRIVNRAQYVTKLISTQEIGQLLDEKITEEEIVDLENAESVCRNLLAWNFQKEEEDPDVGYVKAKLREVLGRSD